MIILTKYSTLSIVIISSTFSYLIYFFFYGFGERGQKPKLQSTDPRVDYSSFHHPTKLHQNNWEGIRLGRQKVDRFAKQSTRGFIPQNIVNLDSPHSS